MININIYRNVFNFFPKYDRLNSFFILSMRNYGCFFVEFVKMLAGAGQEEKEAKQKAAAQNAQKGGATGSTPAAIKSDTKTDTKHDPKHGTPTRKK